MSKNLRNLASRLVRLAKRKTADIKVILKTAPQNLVRALGEIARNAKRGTFNLPKKLKNNNLINKLACKKTTIEVKRKFLKAKGADLVVKGLLASVLVVLLYLTGHGL